MQPKGQMPGFDLDDTVYIPVARAMAMFDRESLMEVDVLYTPGSDAAELAERIKSRLMARHGSEDFTIMTISVNERTPEVGLLRALGAGRNQVMGPFLGEAVVLASCGGLVGLLFGVGGAWLIAVAIPGLPTHVAWDYALLALLIAVSISLIAAVLPATRASALDPVTALRAE